MKFEIKNGILEKCMYWINDDQGEEYLYPLYVFAPTFQRL